MQPAQHPLGAAAVVVLHKLVAGARGVVEGALVETLEKETPRVTEHLGLDQHDVGNGEAGGLHGGFSKFFLEQAQQILAIAVLDKGWARRWSCSLSIHWPRHAISSGRQS